MLIDVHTHTSRFSACSVLPPDRLLERAVQRGLDAVVVTDHEQYWPRREMERLRRRHSDIRVYNGAELTVESLHHVLTILPDPHGPRPDCADPDRFRRSLEELGGFAIAAHPYRFFSDYGTRNESHPLDGVEIASGNMRSAGEVQRSRRLARSWGSRAFASSDAHDAGPLGSFATRIEGVPADESELVRALRESDTAPVFPDASSPTA